MKFREYFFVVLVSIVALVIGISFFWKSILWSLVFLVPIFLVGIYDIIQKKHSILKNYPVVGHFRYLLEDFRPEIQQYFVETDIEGTPINRVYRSIIYQRAKQAVDTTPFGTKMDVYREGYEWINHSIYPSKSIDENDFKRVTIGSSQCAKKYDSSILNISAMSFGALSNRAVMAMNKGAKLGGFAQNTGEGSITPYHLKYGADLIWQIGTGYFGCRNLDGTFNFDLFEEQANLEVVKMIEIKLSQGAKPGHGGILPAKKNTPEIATIRKVEPYTDVFSPPGHTAFSSPKEMLEFVEKLRVLSKGKPIGIKLCVGNEYEFEDICKQMSESKIYLDFVTVDGGEGGTGAAPVEFSNSLGTPLREGLCIVDRYLQKYNLRSEVKIIASGKIFTSFHMARALALGADLCNSARAIMMATGCIQALECNLDTCPVGVATQNKSLIRGLDVEEKAIRVKNYHNKTVHAFMELLVATGLKHPNELEKKHILRRVSLSEIKSYAEIYQ
ncbi:MAG: FMN-binding glutamate synthase family protein [Flavobacteriales bacterium]|nr:FMN-binding glutamate synthase family protein [Flavobacteriales bacterium]